MEITEWGKERNKRHQEKKSAHSSKLMPGPKKGAVVAVNPNQVEEKKGLLRVHGPSFSFDSGK